MQKKILLLVLLIFNAAILRAEFIFRDGYTRAAGMGNAFTAMNDDANVIFFNPAGLGYLDSVELSSNTVKLYGMSDLQINNLAIAMPFNKIKLGIGYDEFGFDLYKEKSYIFSGAYKISNGLAVGANLKMYELQISTVGEKSDMSIDLGFNYSLLDNNLSIGGLIRDVNQPELSDKIDRSYLIGIKYIFMNLKFSADYYKPNFDNDKRIFSGVELDLNKYFALRAGLQTNPSVYSLGFGVNLGRFNILSFDYTYLHHQIMDATHLLGLKYKFGKKAKDDFYEGVEGGISSTSNYTEPLFLLVNTQNFLSFNELVENYQNKEEDTVMQNTEIETQKTIIKNEKYDDTELLKIQPPKKKIEFSNLKNLEKKRLPSLKEQVISSKRNAEASIKKFDTRIQKTPAKIKIEEDKYELKTEEEDVEIIDEQEIKETSAADISELNKVTFIERIEIPKIVNDIDDIWDMVNDEDISVAQAYILIDLFESPLNINTAGAAEFMQLPNISVDDIESIINYRAKVKIIDDAEELVKNDIITQSTFDQISSFIETRETRILKKEERSEMFAYKGIVRERTDDSKKAKVFQTLEYDYDNLQVFGLTERDAGEEFITDLLKIGVKFNNIKNSGLDIVAGNYSVGFGNFHTIATTKYEKKTKTVKPITSIVPQIIDIDRKTTEDKYLQGAAIQKRGFLTDNLNITAFISKGFYDEISDSIDSKLNADIAGGNLNYDLSDRLAVGILGFEGKFKSDELPDYDIDNSVYGMYCRYKTDYDIDMSFEAAKSNSGGKGIFLGIDHKTKKYDFNIIMYSNDPDYINLLSYSSSFSYKDKRGIRPRLRLNIDRNHKLTTTSEFNKIISSDVAQTKSEIRFDANYDKKNDFMRHFKFLKKMQYTVRYSFYENDANYWASSSTRGYDNYFYISYDRKLPYSNPKQAFNIKLNFVNNMDYSCNLNLYKKEGYSYGKPKLDDDFSQLHKLRYQFNPNDYAQIDYFKKTYKDITNYGLNEESIKCSAYWYMIFTYSHKFSKSDLMKIAYQYREYNNSTTQNYHRLNTEFKLRKFSFVLKNYLKYWTESKDVEAEINLSKNF